MISRRLVRLVGGVAAVIASLFGGAAALAADSGNLLRADVLREKPFVDAAALDKLDANDPVEIAARQGAWMQVNARGKSGWVRMLNVRMGAAGAGGGSGGLLAAASVFRTGSSGTTVTTGVKGLGESELRAAQPDRAQLALLAAQAATPADAAAQATGNGLKPNDVAYLKPGRKK